MRTAPLSRDAFPEAQTFYAHMAAPWQAWWIGPASYDPSGTHVFAYKLRVTKPGKRQIHVSADQRYILFLDGKRIGRGPERGDLRHWMYESYDLDLKPGQMLVALTWWISPFCATPPAEAQQTVRPAFMVYAEGDSVDFNTGVARWEMKEIKSMRFSSSQVSHAYYAIDPRITLTGDQHPWGVESGAGEGWESAAKIHTPALGSLVSESMPHWLLRPAMLPAMSEQLHTGSVVRHVEDISNLQTKDIVVRKSAHLEGEAAQWSQLLAGQSLAIPPHTRRRVILDMADYVCAFDSTTTSGGRDALIRISWAESLVTFNPANDKTVEHARVKKRNDVHDQHFVGYGDTFIADGGKNRHLQPLWWGAGRYMEIVVATQDEPLTIHSIQVLKTGYPYQFEAEFHASDSRLEQVIPLGLRTLRMCSHETSMDCPYYEQLNYAGDTRLQSLVAMHFSRDDRLVRKGIELFDWSRTGDTWPSSRWPSRVVQTIPPFAMWWVGMVYDYARYRGDMDFVRKCMPGARSIVERWRQQIDDRGLLHTPAGWNFVDWIGGWPSGVANKFTGSPCGILQWQLVYTLQIASELETMLNEPLLAQRHTQTAAALAATAERHFYNADRGLLANDLEQKQFSEHAQVMALISGHLSQPLRQKVSAALIDPPGDLPTTTIYFSHYTFEALGRTGRIDTLINRMKVWFDHQSMGLYTLLESPEPSRSDCHAWGAHPLYHYFATILGIRPDGFGFQKVTIEPQLGPLSSASGKMVHPLGMIEAKFEKNGERITGEVTVPTGLTGRILANGKVIPLAQGRTTVA